METSKEERPVVAKRLRNRDISVMETSKEDGTTVSQNLNSKKNREIEVFLYIFHEFFVFIYTYYIYSLCWEILVNSQKYRSSYFLNQASKLHCVRI